MSKEVIQTVQADRVFPFTHTGTVPGVLFLKIFFIGFHFNRRVPCPVGILERKGQCDSGETKHECRNRALVVLFY